MNEEQQPKWPHTEQHYNHPDFWNGNPWVTVTEKIHGFNARTGLTEDGLFWVGSRNNVIHEGLVTPVKEPLQGFTEFAIDIEEGMTTGHTYFGEWAGPSIQKGIDYGPTKKFFLFAVMKWNPSKERNELLPWTDVEMWSDRLGCDIVPLYFDGWLHNTSRDEILSWNVGPSDASPSGDEREGIVITQWPPLVDLYGHLLLIKHKHPKFAERAHERKSKSPGPDLTNVQAFVDDYATTERLNHVLQTVQEITAEDPLHPVHTGLVLRTYYEDVIREGASDYTKLSEADQKQVGKVLNSAVKPLLDAARNAAAETSHTS